MLEANDAQHCVALVGRFAPPPNLIAAYALMSARTGEAGSKVAERLMDMGIRAEAVVGGLQ